MLMPKLRVSCLNVLVMNVESVDVSMRSKKEVMWPCSIQRSHLPSNVSLPVEPGVGPSMIMDKRQSVLMNNNHTEYSLRGAALSV